MHLYICEVHKPGKDQYSENFEIITLYSGWCFEPECKQEKKLTYLSFNSKI